MTDKRKQALEALDRIRRSISDIDGVYSWDDDAETIKQALTTPVQCGVEDVFLQDLLHEIRLINDDATYEVCTALDVIRDKYPNGLKIIKESAAGGGNENG